MLPIVLASASPRRQALLRALGVPIEVRVSAVDETAQGEPDAVAVGNAVAKRDDIADRLENPAIVIGADTIVVIGPDTLGKPADLEEARSMLQRLSGNTHTVITGVAVRNTQTNARAEGVERTLVTFRALTAEEIDRFVEAVRPLDRAGAYTVDGPGSLLVERYEGCYQNVLGLPIVRLDHLMREIGDDLFARVRGDSAQFL